MHHQLKFSKDMCQTAIISQHIGRIGRRSFDRRMRLASPLYVEKRGELTRILNEVDKLSEKLHEDFPTITAEDYSAFGSKLRIVISTLKSLRIESMSHRELIPYNERMREQISDLEELDHDIRMFRIKAPQNKELQQAMKDVHNVDFSYLF